jgi:hypothetical protein
MKKLMIFGTQKIVMNAGYKTPATARMIIEDELTSVSKLI